MVTSVIGLLTGSMMLSLHRHTKSVGVNLGEMSKRDW